MEHYLSELECTPDWKEKAREYQAELLKRSRTSEKYYELLMTVETKCPGETRHQTALRLIKEAQHTSDQTVYKEIQ